jgi:hypothetical protein
LAGFFEQPLHHVALVIQRKLVVEERTHELIRRRRQKESGKLRMVMGAVIKQF